MMRISSPRRFTEWQLAAACRLRHRLHVFEAVDIVKAEIRRRRSAGGTLLRRSWFVAAFLQWRRIPERMLFGEAATDMELNDANAHASSGSVPGCGIAASQ